MKTSDLKISLAEKELLRREALTKIDILQDCFPEQLAFIESTARKKALCCNRRSGKSTAIALYMISVALSTPRGKFLYIGLTNESAKGAMWTDIFDTIIRKYGIQNLAHFKETALEIKFSNGATIFLRGMDATPKQMNRVRGQKFRLIAVDEAQSFTQDLNQVVNSIADMTLAENSSSVLLMCGTPGSQLGDHYWWKIMRPDSDETEWEHFNWSWEDNISTDPKTGERVCDNIKKYVEDRIARNPLYVNTPEYKREVLGQWVLDDDQMVYKYNDRLNVFDKEGLPYAFWKNVVYVLSIDLGYYGATAFVILAYNKHFDGNLYIMESHKRPYMTFTDVAREIKALDARYRFTSIVVDAADAQGVETMRETHGLSLIGAEKLGKEAHIATLNADFITNNVRLERNNNKALKAELVALMWDIKALQGAQPKHKEDKRKPNHLTDALLYGHHYSHHYWYNPYREKPVELDRNADMGERILAQEKRLTAQKPFKSYLDQIFNDEENNR